MVSLLYHKSESIYLWLGIRILSVESAGLSKFILGEEGSKAIHSDRLTEVLKKVLSKAPKEEVAEILGCLSSEFSAHDLRKYGAECLACGPDGPNPMAICDRLNHGLGGIIKDYISWRNWGKERKNKCF